jgi:methylmalonyl-CoA/ethylmalonyl-CoA epimerase
MMYLILLPLALVAAVLLIRQTTSTPPAQPDPDAVLLAQLRKSGVDLTQPVALRFSLSLPDRNAAERVARQINEPGLQQEVQAAPTGNRWLCLVTGTLAPTHETMRRLRQHFEALALSERGEYDGRANAMMDLAAAEVAQLLIPVENLDRAITYYRDTLGIPFLFSAPPQMSFFQAGRVRLLVGVPPADQLRQRGATVYFRVADIQAVADTLVSRGVVLGASPHVVHRAPTYDLWLAEFSDPDGNALALMSEVPKQP